MLWRSIVIIISVILLVPLFCALKLSSDISRMEEEREYNFRSQNNKEE